MAACNPEQGHCAPCGAALGGPSVALTFSYDFPEAVDLHSEYEVLAAPASFPASWPSMHASAARSR